MRGRIEDLRRAEREAAARLDAAAKAEPFDPEAYHRAELEFGSAQLALKSRGVAPRRRRASRESEVGNDPPAPNRERKGR